VSMRLHSEGIKGVQTLRRAGPIGVGPLLVGQSPHSVRSKQAASWVDQIVGRQEDQVLRTEL
jgi:hypothetical protein